MNFVELLFKIKDNPKIAFIILLSTLLVFDYFIYTDVFHLNQADFFNYTFSSSNIFSQQFFLVFVILPFILLGIIFLIFRLEYMIFQKIDFKNYFTLKKNSIVIFFTVILMLGIALFGEKIVYFLLDYIYLFLEKLDIKADVFSLFILLNGLFFVVNIITLRFLISLCFIILSQFQFGQQIVIFSCILGFFIGLKLAIYPVIALIFPQFNFDSSQKLFVLLNLLIFATLAILYVSNKRMNKNNSFFDVKKKEIFYVKDILFFGGLIFLVLDTVFVYYNIGKMYRNPYENLSFWQSRVYENSLSSFNLSLFMNSLRISKFHDYKNLKNILKNEHISDLIENKQIPTIILTDINQTINNLMNNIDKKEKIFFLPNNDRKLIFIQDNNKTMTILHVQDSNNSSGKLVDIGYIELKN